MLGTADLHLRDLHLQAPRGSEDLQGGESIVDATGGLAHSKRSAGAHYDALHSASMPPGAEAETPSFRPDTPRRGLLETPGGFKGPCGTLPRRY